MKVLSQLIKFISNIFAIILIRVVTYILTLGILGILFVGAMLIFIVIPFGVPLYLSSYVPFVDSRGYSVLISYLVFFLFLSILVVSPRSDHALSVLKAFVLGILDATFKTLEALNDPYYRLKISASLEKKDTEDQIDETKNESSL